MEITKERKPTTMRNLATMLRRKSGLAMGGSALLRRHLDDEIETYAYGHKGFFALVKIRGGYAGCEFTLLFDHWGCYKGIFTEVPVDYALDNIKNCPFLVERVVPSEDYSSKFGELIGEIILQKDDKLDTHKWYEDEMKFKIYKRGENYSIVELRRAVREEKNDERTFLDLLIKGKKWDCPYILKEIKLSEGYDWEQILAQLKSQFLLKEL